MYLNQEALELQAWGQTAAAKSSAIDFGSWVSLLLQMLNNSRMFK